MKNKEDEKNTKRKEISIMYILGIIFPIIVFALRMAFSRPGINLSGIQSYEEKFVNGLYWLQAIETLIPNIILLIGIMNMLRKKENKNFKSTIFICIYYIIMI